jgi:flagellar biosynthesis protein
MSKDEKQNRRDRRRRVFQHIAPQHRNDGAGSAVALRYDGVNAPRVTAKGEGDVADRILQIAEAHGIPLHEDPALAALLSYVELGDEIPAQLYVAVAEVIAFAYYISDRYPHPETQARHP